MTSTMTVQSVRSVSRRSRDDLADSVFEMEARDYYPAARSAYLYLIARRRQVYLQRLASAAEPGSRYCIHGTDVCGPYDCYCGACESGECDDFGWYMYGARNEIRQYVRQVRYLMDAARSLQNAGLADQLAVSEGLLKLQKRAHLDHWAYRAQLEAWRQELRLNYLQQYRTKQALRGGLITQTDYVEEMMDLRAERFGIEYKIENPDWHPGF